MKVKYLIIDDLTKRELEVARLTCDGFLMREIAEKMGIETHTVKNHRYHIYAKLGVRTETELVAMMFRTGKVS